MRAWNHVQTTIFKVASTKGIHTVMTGEAIVSASNSDPGAGTIPAATLGTLAAHCRPGWRIFQIYQALDHIQNLGFDINLKYPG